MYCCSKCFEDRFLIPFVEQVSNLTNTCFFCASTNVPVIEADILSDRFQILFDLYEISEDGLSMHDCLQNDWQVFSSLLDSAKRDDLLTCISGGNVGEKYKSKIQARETRIEQWNVFREELKYNNRYFPDNVPDADALKNLFEMLVWPNEDRINEIFRARICKRGFAIPAAEMGKPPGEKAVNGRANPIGIPYLYTASDEKTAISEVRPYKGERVTVAKIRIDENLELADLRNPRHTISPFMLEENDLENLYSEMPFLVTLGEELSKPIIPREAALEYLPSQYLCELVKHIGFDGILYKSSLARGYNIALFHDTGFEIVDTKTFQIINNEIEYLEETKLGFAL